MIAGVDIGGSKMEVAVFDDALALVDRWRVPTPTRDYAAFVEAVAGLIEDADKKFGIGNAVGLGVPGLIDANGNSLSANVPCATGHPVAADLARRIGRPVAIENDCRCFALSEAIGGAGDDYRTVYGAIIGTGAAAGLVVAGNVERGRQGIAGEYGHLPISAALVQRHQLPIWQCGCGLPDCMESYIAGPGLLALSRHFGIVCDNVPMLAAAWRGGDSAALKTRECFLDILGSAFAAVVKMLDPDIIVLGGGVSLLDEVLEGLPSATQRHLFAGFDAPPFVRARFGDSSGVRGAAILAQRIAT